MLDAVSEIANMIIGGFKTTAELYLGALGLSIPTVIYGLSFSARSVGKEQWIVVPFTGPGVAVEVKICLTPNRGLPHLAVLAPARWTSVSWRDCEASRWDQCRLPPGRYHQER